MSGVLKVSFPDALNRSLHGPFRTLRACLRAFCALTPTSTQQVLAPLSAADVVLVGALPAVSEELLFRGALIPAVYPDWCALWWALSPALWWNCLSMCCRAGAQLTPS
jgi:membrane protease YdiL (CAAX protease family)